MTEDTYDFVVRDKSAQPPYCKPPPALFVCYRLRGKGTITFLIWHVTSGENVIKGSHYSEGDHLLSSDITLSSLAAVSAVSVESYHFFLAWPHMRTRSKENTNFCVVALVIRYALSNLLAIELLDVEIDRILFFTWTHCITCSEGHIDLLVMVPYLYSPPHQVWWHQVFWKWRKIFFCISTTNVNLIKST